MHLEDVTAATELVIMAIEAGRKDKLKLDISLKLPTPVLWICPDPDRPEPKSKYRGISSCSELLFDEQMDAMDKFYLGRVFDAGQSQTAGQRFLYNPADLTTHAVVVGMTGSGKTGLCIDLLEEAALAGIPALMIDPKGDITNALLHFPDLLPGDFQPWVDPDQAGVTGSRSEQAAADTAAAWRKGLSDWEIQPERLRALKKRPILRSIPRFRCGHPGQHPGLVESASDPLGKPSELLREKISGTVTALLGLVGWKTSIRCAPRAYPAVEHLRACLERG